MDTPELNNLSEIESLSDSDWLDIASSRASDDNDSIAGFDDSDREEISDRPSSRMSLNHGENEAQGWEGLIEDIPTEPSPKHDPLILEPLTLSPLEAAQLGSAPLVDTDPEEEQRVKEALDQSMMSTLSSSRSNSLQGSIQTSIVHSRDLRLSFPDPLTGSQVQSLNPSYDDLSPFIFDVPQSDADLPLINAPHSASPALDPGSFSIPEVSACDSSTEMGFVPRSHDVTIILYGRSSPTKDVLVDTILRKYATVSGEILSAKRIYGMNAYSYYFDTNSGHSRRMLSIIDRTGIPTEDDSKFSLSSNNQSLAIVFLPSLTISLDDHTFYLPIHTSSSGVVDCINASDSLLEAEQQWDMLDIPKDKMLSPSSSVIDQDELDQLKAVQVYRALHPLFTKEETRRFNSGHRISIITVLSIVLGYVVTRSLWPVSPSESTVSILPISGSPAWTPSPGATVTNHTVSPSTVESSSISVVGPTTGIVPSSLKDFALSVFNPISMIASTSSILHDEPATPSVTLTTNDSPSECECGCGLITWSRSSTDLSLRPIPSFSAQRPNPQSHDVLAPPLSHGSLKSKGHTAIQNRALYALSTRLAGSLSEYFHYRVISSTIPKDMHLDLQEIIDALDELVYAIGRQTALAWTHSKNSIQVLGGRIQGRHARAQTNARLLKEMGERIISSVSESVMVHIGQARENALALKNKAAGLDVGTTPGKVMKFGAEKRRLMKERRKAARGTPVFHRN